MISLDATSSGTGNTGWLELRPAFSVGAVWSSGETRRPESATRCIRHCWRRAGSRSPSCSLRGGISLRGQAPSGSGVSISWKHLGAVHTPYTWLRLVWSSVEEHRESLFALCTLHLFSGLFAPPSTYRLVIGSWGSCEPVGGSGACGLGVSRRVITCFDDEDYPQQLELCENGLETPTQQGCTVDCPELVVSKVYGHPNFFGILRPGSAFLLRWLAY